jgi:PAS domain S-box-containing protein
VNTHGNEAEVTDRNAPVTQGAANDWELTRLMAGLPGMVYRASARPPFAFEIVGGGYERILGRSLDELTTKPDIRSTIMYPDDVARYRAAAENAVKCGDTFQIEYSVIHPDTTDRVVWEQGGPVRTPDGSCFIEGSIIDIEGPVHARQVQDATYRISQVAASAESLQELYGRIHHIIAELMPSENLYFALRDPKTGFIMYPYYIDEYDVVPPDPQIAETGVTAYILRTGVPLLLSEFSEAEPIKSGSIAPTGTPAISWLGVPLQLKGSTIGVMAVQVYHGSYRYTEQDRNILSFVADQIAVAIERQRATASIQESELRYRSLFEDSPVALWEEDFSELSKHLKDVLPPGTGDVALWLHSHPKVVRKLASLVRVIDVNRATLRLAGASQKSELVGSLVTIMPDEAFEVFELELVHIATGDPSFQWEGPASTVHGEPLSISMHWMVTPGDEETLCRVLVAMVDVTDRVRTERALQASELKFRTLFNQAQDAMLLDVVNADGTVGSFIEANDVACQWVGYTHEELQHMDVTDIMVAPTPTALEQMGRQLREQGKATFAVELKARDGHRIPVEVSASVFTLEGRTAVLSIIRDITERLRLESELQRMEKLESLGVLAGGIAHDFNNMLTGIIGNINLARIEDDTDHSHELLEEAEREVLQARGLTQQLLTFAKGGAPVRSVQDLAHVLREAVSFALRGSNVLACFDLPADLWWASVDKGQLSQVFSNIVINADEAMPAGGTVSVVARNVTIDEGAYPDLAPGDYVRINLSDTGVGIAETDLRRIFDPFFSTKRRGSGLGLATSYAIVHKHGGYISVSSIPGAGTTFSIFLPAAPASPSPQSRETAPQFSGHGRVLVMDDELTVRQVAVAMLKKLGYEAEAVPDGASALRSDAEARAAGRPFSTIIMDLTIPGGMGGKEAVVALRAQRTTARLIASSGYANDPVMAQYRSYQFDAVLAKPYSFAELTSVLASLADQPSILDTDA